MDIKQKKLELKRLTEKTDNLNDIINGARKIILNPIMLFDIMYNHIEHSFNQVTDDPLWNEIVTLGRFSHESVDFFKEEGFIEAYAESEALAIMKSDKLKYDRVNCSIYDVNGEQTGNVLIVACEKPFEDGDFELLLTLAENIGDKPGLKNFMHSETETTLAALLEERDVDEIKYCRLLQEIDYKPDALIYIGVVDVMGYDRTLTHLVYFRELFSRIQSKFKYYVYMNNIIILAAFSSGTPKKAEIAGLDAFFNKNNLFAGISGRFGDMRSVKRYFKQALNALNYGMDSGDKSNIFFYDDLKLGLNVRDNAELTDICHPTALNIYIHDTVSGTDYLNSLYLYFKDSLTGKSHADGAGTLIKEIAGNFNIDFTDENTLFSIYASIKLIKLFRDKAEKLVQDRIKNGEGNFGGLN